MKQSEIAEIDKLHQQFIDNQQVDPYHTTLPQFIDIYEKSKSKFILEIGSRNVTGRTNKGLFQNFDKYVGFDILDGECVDVVGDIHQLGTYFDVGYFDFVFSISVFEHLLFPWKAVLEINKVLKKDGFMYLSTHPVWPAHELPWDFWRFPPGAFHAILNEYTGFKITCLNVGLPAKMYSLAPDPPTRTNCEHIIHQGISVIAQKTGDYRADLLKWDINPSNVLQTMYPKKI